MQTITLSDLEPNLRHYLDEVALRGERIIVAGDDGDGNSLRVMIVPIAPIKNGDDFDRAGEMDETEYLLSNPANAASLRESLAQARRGEVIQVDLRDLLDPDPPGRWLEPI